MINIILCINDNVQYLKSKIILLQLLLMTFPMFGQNVATIWIDVHECDYLMVKCM